LFYFGRQVETSVGFQSFGIELSSRAALQTTAVCRFSLGERAADVVMPAAKEFRHYAHLLTEYIVVHACLFVFPFIERQKFV
jgi:hypothetical protein